MNTLVFNPLDEQNKKAQTEQVQEQRKEYKFIGSQKRQKGHILFSINSKTMEIKEAVIVEKSSFNALSKQMEKKREVKIEPDCYYGQALNKKNFIRKLIKKGLLIERKCTTK